MTKRSYLSHTTQLSSSMHACMHDLCCPECHAHVYIQSFRSCSKLHLMKIQSYFSPLRKRRSAFILQVTDDSIVIHQMQL